MPPGRGATDRVSPGHRLGLPAPGSADHFRHHEGEGHFPGLRKGKETLPPSEGAAPSSWMVTEATVTHIGTMTNITTSGPNRSRRFVGVLLVGAIALGGCGDDGKSSTTASGKSVPSNDEAESAYCQTARKWSIHEINRAGVDDNDPKALRAYMVEYVAFIDEASAEAPASLADEWKASSEGFKTMVLPVLDKYDYDVERIAAKGTAEEQAVDQPPPAVAEAQDTIHEYEAVVCGAGQPPASDEKFAGPPSKEYCEASGSLNAAASEAITAEDSPKAMKALLTGGDLTKLMAATEVAAPEEIKADVVALNKWDREKKTLLTARYGYDIRRIVLEGTAAERAILQTTDPSIRDHYARVAAYEAQQCSAES